MEGVSQLREGWLDIPLCMEGETTLTTSTMMKRGINNYIHHFE